MSEELETNGMRWFVLRTATGYEKRVVTALREAMRIANMEDYFGEIIVPTEEVVEMRSGQKRKTQRKFFPGYVLLQVNMTDEIWHLVRRVPHVLGFIGGRRERPVPISDKEIDRILSRVQECADKPRPKVLFEVGESVRVTDGPFKDFDAEVKEVSYEKNRLCVSVLVFGRPTPLDLEFGQVEKS